LSSNHHLVSWLLVVDHARRPDGYMFEGFWLSRALSCFSFFLSWEGVSDLGGVVE
jgi:hypothetical protein